MSMKITVLGCGASGGVPLIGGQEGHGDWGNCDPTNPRNRRSRASIVVDDGTTRILVDSSPDLRQQLLSCGISHLDAVIYTHLHADHCHGIDDLRWVNIRMGKALPIYANQQTIEYLSTSFSYALAKAPDDKRFYRPVLLPHVITPNVPFTIGTISILPFFQDHGAFASSLGFRFGDFAYSTDAVALDDTAFSVLAGTKAWIVDCLNERPHPTHAHLDRSLEWIATVKPDRAWLTHMDHTMDYARISALLPAGVEPAYDGLEIEA